MQASISQVGTYPLRTIKVESDQHRLAHDVLAVEEPLEIQLGFGAAGNRTQRSLSITMRTPGQDAELAAGFLFTEGIIGQASHIIDTRHVGQALHEDAQDNVVLVELSSDVALDFEQLSRHFYTSSSCGVCGKASIDMVRTTTCYYPRHGHPQVTPGLLHQLPERLRQAQALFEHTGGIHAAGLFDAAGQLILMREDVGRHNALDKLIGAALLQGLLPLREHIVLVSGRVSFELVQKAAMAGVPILAAVGAPSSLAVRLAGEHGMTIVGFLRNQRFNVYRGQERIVLARKEQEEPTKH